MNQQDYRQAVKEVLSGYTEQAVVQLGRALAALPEETQEVAIDVMVDQEGEGYLTVCVGVIGPDLYVLNKAISPFATLFDTIMGENGLSPNLPLMGGDDFVVGDVLTDTAAQWVRDVWALTAHAARGLPVVIVSPAGFGSDLPISLQ